MRTDAEEKLQSFHNYVPITNTNNSNLLCLVYLHTGSASAFPDFSFASSACLFSSLCINILRFPRLLQLAKRFPARFTPAFPTTVPRADAAT